MRCKSGFYWWTLWMVCTLGFPLWAWGAEATPKKIERLIVGAGSVSGVYFPAAGAVCRDVNQYFNKSVAGTVHCAVEPTEGSVENVHLLQDGDIQFGIVQSDVISNAWNGLPPFDAKRDKLRSVVALYNESLTVVTRGDSGIKEWGDLQGKKISIGQKGSGSRRTATELIQLCNVAPKVLDEDKELTADGATVALRNKEIDAYFFVVGHPNENVWNALANANAHVLKLPQECLERAARKYPYYVRTNIPGGLYPSLPQAVPSLAVKATLMTTTDMDENTAYQFTRTIVEKLYRFSRLDPDFLIPDPRSLFEGLVVPLHLGAFKYFQE
ncbi:MAG TPA: TAXI family TRAP transporter solute-binding subunit, partial [Magnetococcales bacterium]|nr:TAXI family TRAP transporter solute-binding subunit [Magnetococcales bacterium]